MRKIMKILGIITATALLLGGAVVPVAATPEVTVSVDAPDEVTPDSDFTANVNISEVVDFDSCNYDVSFDALVLRLDNVTSGLIDSTTIPVDICNEISSGTYRVIQNAPGLAGVSGSGYLAVLHFHVIGSEGDSSSISLANGMLSDNLAEGIPATWVGDSVSIQDATPPSVTITELSSDPTNDNTPTFTGTATDTSSNISSVEYKVDGGSWTAATASDGAFDSLSEGYTFTTSALADGGHTVYVRATDSATNTTAEANYASDSFTVDATAPSITSTAPEADATDVAVGTTVSVTFNEAMDSSTITTSSFTLGGVSGSVTYDSGTYTAAFTPGADLEEGTTYTATLSTAITDAAGNPLASAYSWSFTTEVGVIVSIDAPDEAAAGSDFTANVNISEVVDFDGCNYDVSFDASVLRLDNVTSGLIGSTTIPVDIYNEISSGTYRVVQNVPGLAGVSGSGYLAVLHFHVIGAEGDSSSIILVNGMLSDNLAEEIAAAWIGDSVDVTSSVLPGDATGDGNINALDITKVERTIGGLDAETPGADANQDGSVNALDITQIERIIAGLG